MPDTSANAQPLLEARTIVKHFPIRGGVFMKQTAAVKAVDGVSLTIRGGETLGLVGESGCGKTTFGRIILRLEEPTSGDVLFQGRSILGYSKHEMQALRREMQIIFQDPFSSLNPRKTVGHIVGEPLLRPRSEEPPGAGGAGAGTAGGGGAAPGAHAALPAPVLRRTAPAHRRRPGARPQAQADHLRRGGLGPGRLDPGPGDQPAQGPPGGVRPDLSLHLPRPERRRARQRPRGGHVPGKNRRNRPQPRPLPRTAPPLFPGPALGRPGARPVPAATQAASS